MELVTAACAFAWKKPLSATSFLAEALCVAARVRASFTLLEKTFVLRPSVERYRFQPTKGPKGLESLRIAEK